MTSSKKNPTDSSCFSSIRNIFICAGYLPTHPCPPEEILERNPSPTKNNASLQIQAQAQVNPGIVARLMGLDSLPKPYNTSLFRSKSLNSLHFLPNFDPTRAAFHRRARTSSASFHEQGHGFLGRIDENLETSGANELRQTKDDSRENALKLKEKECRRNRKKSESKKKYQQERYYNGNCSKTRNNWKKHTGTGEHVSNTNCCRENGVTPRRKLVKKDRNIKSGWNVSSKNKVDHHNKQGNCVDVITDASSRSPVSVLDQHQLEFGSPSREDVKPTQTTSNSSSKKRSSQKISCLDDMPQQHTHLKSYKSTDDESANKVASQHKSVKEEAEVGEYFVDLSKQIFGLAEEQLYKDLRNHIRKYRLFEAHFVEQLCQDLCPEMLEFLLNELTNELVEPL